MTIDTSTSGGNSPVYNEAGERIVLAECWRIPSWPFASPSCCGDRARMIGWNLYRCRLGLGTSFREKQRVRDLFRVVRQTTRIPAGGPM